MAQQEYHNTFLHYAIKNDADLLILSKWMEKAKVIGVGEPTHGTSETGLFRLRLFQYLVEHEGFNVFIVEDQLPECGLMNDYVIGKTDSTVVHDYLFKGGATQETLKIINWLRDYNRSHPLKIQFAGMDMQSAKVALDNIKRFADLHDKNLSFPVKELILRSEGFTKNWYDTAGIAIKWPFIQKPLAALTTLAEIKVPLYYSSLPRDSVNWFVLNLTILKQFFTESPQQRTVPYRDSCMAKNIIDFSMLYPEAKLLISAHNMHVAASKTDFAKWMGSWLHDYFDSSYYRLAIAVGNGYYTAAEGFNKRIYKSYPLQKPYPSTAEYYFEKVNKENFIFSLANKK